MINQSFRQRSIVTCNSRSTGGRTITSLRFADDIDGLVGKEKLAKLVERLDKASTAYGMEINAEKTKPMTNNTRGISTCLLYTSPSPRDEAASRMPSSA